MTHQPLAGIRVLDLTQHVAGPYCTKLLADYGAEVIKIERPGLGDRSRRLGPFPGDVPDPEKSGLFLHLNTSKKGVTLDVETATGREMFRRMAAQVDLVVEDLGPEGMEKLGLGFEALSQLNPKLVMTSISNFGSRGPYKDNSLTDMTAYAVGGWMFDMGDPQKPPLQPAADYCFYFTGQYAAVGSLSALMHALWTGQGQRVSTSVMLGVVAALIYDTVLYAYRGTQRARSGNRRTGVSISIQPCADGYLGFYVGPGEQRWQDLFTVLLGRPDLADDPRLQTTQGRIDRTDELEAIVQDWLKDKTAEEVFHLGQELRLLFATIPTTAEVLQLDQHKAREYFVEAEHPRAGRLTYTGAPFWLDDNPWQLQSTAPLLGQHNGEVYRDYLGLGDRDLVTLRQAGII